jgi:SAM-dependent methyltransferase
MHDYEGTRRSWNVATRNHNAHKGDQAACLRGGGDTLFPEELDLLGPLNGKTLVHLQCNSGQDSLCLARRGARVTGVDLSDEAISFARNLSRDSGIAAEFIHSEVVGWMQSTTARFELAFSSYGAVGWLPDLDAWAAGVTRILQPGGRFVYVEFHPLVWSLGKEMRADADDYFSKKPFVDPVPDYVAESGAALGAIQPGSSEENTQPATSWQHGFAEVLNALAQSGLKLERIHEYPYSNGCRVHSRLVPREGRTWVWPPGIARTPLMFGITARR